MKLIMVACIVFFVSAQANAHPMMDDMDHPVIKPMPRSHLVPAQSDRKNFSPFEFRVNDGKKSKTIEKKGKYWHLRYLIKNDDGQIDRRVSREEIVENYRVAALEKGGSILYQVGYLLTFTLPRQDGGTTWAFLSAGNGNYNLDIIDEAAFERQLTFGAEALKKALDEEGHVAVYGIQFDIDKETLKLGAEKALIEMVKLMKNNPDLQIEIQGHTDDTGSTDHNLELSARRAETVRRFLHTYGIEQSRMVPKGYGEDKPVASNGSEEGRAMNRRVELVKIN